MVRDVGIYCGVEGGTTNFLLRQQQWEECNKKSGRQCCPIFVVCMGNGKKVNSVHIEEDRTKPKGLEWVCHEYIRPIHNITGFHNTLYGWNMDVTTCAAQSGITIAMFVIGTRKILAKMAA